VYSRKCDLKKRGAGQHGGVGVRRLGAQLCFGRERVLLLFADKAVHIRDGLLGSRGDIGLQLLVGAYVSKLDFSSMPKIVYEECDF
jgi:hypothetical protein